MNLLTLSESLSFLDVLLAKDQTKPTVSKLSTAVFFFLMAAYAALVSLMNTVEQIKIHPLLSNTFDMEETESLGETVAFLLDFIESHNCGGVSKEVEDLESRIASAAYKAEDAIESHVVDQLLPENDGLLLKMVDCCRKWWKKPTKLHLLSVICDLQKVKEDVEVVKKEGRFKARAPIVASSRPISAGKTSMVGFEDYLIQLMDRLTWQPSQQKIIPIIGMPGIGKTTLARNAFENLLIQSHFDVCGWATISQSYNVREILLQLLSTYDDRKKLITCDEGQLGEKLHKYLFSRRYLIVLDDMWSIDAWDEIKFFIPNNCNGSCIVVTSRIHDISLHFNSPSLAISFLDEDKSWNLFCQESFGEKGCPAELEEVGKKICENCKGLPLCIVVIGGFLRESSNSREYWEGVARDTYSILNSQEDNHCMNMLSLSYNHMPAHLKPCFLYMGVFAEDEMIKVSTLIKIWVAEGFIRPNDSQTLEEVANGYLTDLVGRNLVLVNQWGSNGKMRACNIHDLTRELCLSISVKEKCLWVMKLVGSPQAINMKRRVLSVALGVASLEADLRCVNLRVLNRRLNGVLVSQHIPKRIYLLWNLQMVGIVGHFSQMIAPSQVWEMIQLRHLNVYGLCLPDPPRNGRSGLLLPNLQTLCTTKNFRLSEEVCKRIPNIKKLGLNYYWRSLSKRTDESSYYCPQNLGRFHKLESLKLEFDYHSTWRRMVLNMTFPSSLKKLSLSCSELCWEDLELIGSLPNLEVLKLKISKMRVSEWNPIEGEFQRLKFLEISGFSRILKWNADESHFPVLEKLVLGQLHEFDEIPSGIGDIPTLRTIHVHHCSLPCALSAVKILEEQDGLGNEDLQVEVVYATEMEKGPDVFREMLEQAGGFTSKNLRIKRVRFPW